MPLGAVRQLCKSDTIPNVNWETLMKSRRSAFATPALVLASLLLAPLAAVAQLPNAWQITDNTNAAGPPFSTYRTKLQHVIL